MHTQLFESVQCQSAALADMADAIFDHPQCEGQETFASELLCRTLADAGFEVTRGCGGLPTAFRAVYRRGTGGPAIGLLCEYDALRGLGHGCGHHIQGAAVCGAAMALAKSVGRTPFSLVVYGTPDEEIHGGKIAMLQAGCFQELDAVLMCHGYDRTFVDRTYPFSVNLQVEFHGISAHAAIAPEKGRSAFDALMLTFHGMEFMREHVRDGARMHGAVLDAGGPYNVVPEYAKGEFCLRYQNLTYLQDMLRRFRNIVEGAALMTETTFSIREEAPFYGKVDIPQLDELLLKNAGEAGALRISGPRPKTGTTDFGNVSYHVPGAMLGIAMAPEGTAVHTEAFLAAGKTPEAHSAITQAACTLAASAWDLIASPPLLEEVRQTFLKGKQDLETEQ